MDQEEWRNVVGYEGLYQVSSHGRVTATRRQGSKGGLKTASVSKSDGYIYVSLHQVGVREYWRVAVHILVARAFIGDPPEGHEVSHEDGNRENPHVSNLKYRTRKDNLSLRDRHGTDQKGANAPMVKLTEDQVREIRNTPVVRWSKDQGYTAVGQKYGVEGTTIRAIQRGQTWSDLR